MSATLRILYVDDDDDIRTIATMALQLDPALDVRTAASGQAALALLNEGSWKPDLVLLDVMMPGMDGFALHEALRARSDLPGLKTVFMTARASRAGLEDYIATGADGVILKPFDPLQLAGEVRTICDRAR